ncbi:MAG: hypothetical protein ACC641_04660 [Acidiferrobacterales bacterium]
MTIMLMLLIIVLFAFAFLCRAIAAKRNPDKVFWFVMGLSFGPLALPFVMFTGTREI